MMFLLCQRVSTNHFAIPEKCITLTLHGFPGGSDGKESACNVGDLGSVPGLGRSPGGGYGRLLQYSFLPGESPWTEMPGGVQSMGSQRGGHD